MKNKTRKSKLLELNAQTLRALTGGASMPGMPEPGPTPIPGPTLPGPIYPGALESSCNSGCLSLSHGPKPYTCVPC